MREIKPNIDVTPYIKNINDMSNEPSTIVVMAEIGRGKTTIAKALESRLNNAKYICCQGLNINEWGLLANDMKNDSDVVFILDEIIDLDYIPYPEIWDAIDIRNKNKQLTIILARDEKCLPNGLGYTNIWDGKKTVNIWYLRTGT